MPRNSSRVASASSDNSRSCERSLSVSWRSRESRARCSARSSRRTLVRVGSLLLKELILTALLLLNVRNGRAWRRRAIGLGARMPPETSCRTARARLITASAVSSIVAVLKSLIRFFALDAQTLVSLFALEAPVAGLLGTSMPRSLHLAVDQSSSQVRPERGGSSVGVTSFHDAQDMFPTEQAYTRIGDTL